MTSHASESWPAGVERQLVLRSSNVAATGYDKTSATLIVEYLTGGTYCWKGIPAEEYVALRTASSVGKYLRALAAKYGKGTRIG